MAGSKQPLSVIIEDAHGTDAKNVRHFDGLLPPLRVELLVAAFALFKVVPGTILAVHTRL
ncbi:MAG: hypothetical protein KF884_10225 [Fimbriimonadaceae bacterium]|nr:hypothetical protein [Fimbriimonadaceae bacterium]QYK57923.1 MAG: hypothetical protein KF884_10225 [Fimbriimonadaceae bacterium]